MRADRDTNRPQGSAAGTSQPSLSGGRLEGRGVLYSSSERNHARSRISDRRQGSGRAAYVIESDGASPTLDG